LTILPRQERERLVLDLYNEGKTYRKISEEARIYPRNIRVILNKAVEEKTVKWKEEIKQQDDIDKHQQQQEQQLRSLFTQAYKLFSEDKSPIQVSIDLNLRQS
jgi:hypothetical protein